MKKLAILLALIGAGTALAQCTLRPRTYATHNQKLYYYNSGHYYEYSSGNHGQLYYYDTNKYHEYKETIVLVPKAIQVEVQRDHYYSINNAVSQDLLADAIVGRLLRMQGELKSSPRVTPSVGTGPTGPAKSAGDDRAGAYQDAAMLKIVTDSCVKCHGPTAKFTKFVTSDGKLTDLPAGKVWEAFGLVNSGEMPKGGKSLADDDVKAFYAWAKVARKD